MIPTARCSIVSAVLLAAAAAAGQGNWQNRTPAAGPVARTNAALAYDQARGNSVLFGGYDAFNSIWRNPPVSA